MREKLTRREFLRAVGMTAAGALLSQVGCKPPETSPQPVGQRPVGEGPNPILPPTEIPIPPAPTQEPASILIPKPTETIKPTRTLTLTPEPTKTQTKNPTKEPPTPTKTKEPIPTPTETKRPPQPTPTISLEMGIGLESGMGGESLGAIFKGLELTRTAISKKDFETKNPNCLLLVPEDLDGNLAKEQNTLSFTDQEGKTWILANFNMPMPKVSEKDPSLLGPPVFNTEDFQNLMGFWNKEGDFFYHPPITQGKENHSLVIFWQEGELKQGLLDQKTNKLTQSSPYWQKMADEAIKIKMVRYQDAVYLVFTDNQNKPLDKERIKLLDLPKQAFPSEPAKTEAPMPTETPTPTETPRPTETPLPTETPTPVCGELKVVGERTNVNLRTGPGTNFPLIPAEDKQLSFGEVVSVEYRTQDGGWVRGSKDGTRVWLTTDSTLVAISCGLERVPLIPPDQIPPTPTRRPTNTPEPTRPTTEMVTQGNGWRFENLNPEVIEVGINPTFVKRLEELMKQYGTNTLTYTIFKTCPIELGSGRERYCVGLRDGTRGCPVRRLISKGRVLIYPEPGYFDLLRRHSIENGDPIERYYTVWLIRAVTGSDGPEGLPLLNEFLFQKGVIVKLNYLK